ncbi:hypothetical protein C4572_02865 [Candidatus Parcubacteria bacterium]|nr:MAG: hypothetical protein C4572_02865 [Candidatus Parcubacteria bacterium]
MKETIFLPETIIDAHCHGRDMKQKHKTTVSQTLKEALNGNISTTVFMPNTEPPITDLNTLSLYLGLIGQARISLALKNKQYLYFGVTDDNLSVCDDALKCDSVVGLKIYPKKVTTGGNSIGISKKETLKEALKLAATHGKVVAVHCDDPEVIANEGHTIKAEVAYLKKVIGCLRQVPRAKTVICHVSCRDSAEMILKAQRKGLKIGLEICPHYLWFDSDYISRIEEMNPGLGLSDLYHCYNKIRSRNNRHYLIALLRMNNPLIFIGSDNAPHSKTEKFQEKLGGLPTNQEMVAVVVTLALRLGISEAHLANLLCHNTANFLGIPVSIKTRKYKLVKKADDIEYNNGTVVNPWNGSELYFPIPVNNERKNYDH